MHGGSDVQLDEVELFLQIGFSELASDANARVNRNGIDWTPGSLDRLPELFHAVVGGEVGLHALNFGAEAPKIASCFFGSRAPRRYQEVVSILGEHSRQLISDAAGGAGHYCK